MYVYLYARIEHIHPIFWFNIHDHAQNIKYVIPVPRSDFHYRKHGAHCSYYKTHANDIQHALHILLTFLHGTYKRHHIARPWCLFVSSKSDLSFTMCFFLLCSVSHYVRPRLIKSIQLSNLESAAFHGCQQDVPLSFCPLMQYLIWISNYIPWFYVGSYYSS